MRPHDNDDIDGIGELRLSPDDVRDVRGNHTAKRQNRVVAEPRSGASGWVVGLLFVLLLAVTGAAGWQIWLMQQSLVAAENRIAGLQSGVAQVTGKISETGDSIAENETNLQSRMKHIDSEIRKLWDVANKRNRKWIEESRSQTSELDKQLDQLQKTVTALDSGLKEEQNRVEKLAADQGSFKQQQTKQGQQLAALQKIPVARIEEQIAEQEARLRLITGEQKQLKATLEKRIASQQDALNAMDTYRQQINSKLLQLQEALRDMQSKPSSQAQLEIH